MAESGGKTARVATRQERTDIVRNVYDHLRRVRDDDMELYNQYMQKIQRLLTVHIVLFASLSFGLTQLSWVKNSPLKDVHFLALGLIAFVGGASLLVAFLSCVTCLGIEKTSTVGVRVLEELVRNEDLYKFTTSQLIKDLSANIAAAIVQERDHAKKREGLAWVINWSTRLGVAFVALFLMYAIIGNMSSTLAIGANTVKSDRKIEAAEKPPAEKPPQGGDEPPTAVERPEEIVRKNDPPAPPID